MGDLSRIYTNVAALRASLTLSNVNQSIIQSQERISTGLKINRASDSPSGYFISRQLENSIVTSQRQQMNIERGINFLQTNDSKLSQTADIIQEMIDLANQAKSDAVSSAEKQAISLEIRQLTTEANIILTSGVAKNIQTSTTTNLSIGDIDDIEISGSFSTSALTIEATDLLVTGTITDVNNAITNLNTALNKVVQMEEQIGAYISRLDVRLADQAVEEINNQASLSTIRDTDLADETVELTKLQILQQASIASLSQANAAPQPLLVLLGFGG
ncbi:flagellin [candidate division KSB1 bacterium]